MKTGKSLLLLATAMMFSMVSCQKEETPGIQPEKELIEMTFSSLTTKTTLDASHNVLWKSTDHIGVFSEGQIYDFTTQQEGTQATFTGQIVPTGTYYAVYPYDKNATIAGEVISTEIPAVQVAVKGGFADGANVTVAKTSGAILEFKNVCGLLQFEISRNDIASVTFEAAGGEKAAGAVNITVSDTPSWTAPSGSSSVTLSASAGTLEPGVYYLAVLPQTYNGFTLTFTNAEGQTATKTSEAVLEVKRADGLNLQVLDEGITFAAAAPVYEIDLSGLDFSASNIYEAKDVDKNVVAIICKEFLKTSNQLAVVVYGIKKGGGIPRVMDSGNPVGLVAKVLQQGETSQYQTYTAVEESALVHGGIYSFKSDVMAYTTAGSKAALNKVYATYDPEAVVSSISDSYAGTAQATVIEPRTLILSDRGDTKAYKLTKIGRQIWMMDNLLTTKLNDGTSIPKADKAADLQNAEADMYVAVNSATYAYNGAVVLTEKLAPSGWKVPTKTDATTLLEYAGQLSYSLNASHNNVTGFSSQYAARVTTKYDNTLDPAYWCSNAKDSSNKMQCFVTRKDGTKPVTSGQSYKFGFWVRLMRGLY